MVAQKDTRKKVVVPLENPDDRVPPTFVASLALDGTLATITCSSNYAELALPKIQSVRPRKYDVYKIRIMYMNAG